MYVSNDVNPAHINRLILYKAEKPTGGLLWSSMSALQRFGNSGHSIALSMVVFAPVADNVNDGRKEQLEYVAGVY